MATENLSNKKALVSKKNNFLGLGLLNDVSPTHIRCLNSFKLQSPNPFWNLSWETLSDPHSIDHLPIIITAYYSNPTHTNSSNQFIVDIQSFPIHYNFNKTNWISFSLLTHNVISSLPNNLTSTNSYTEFRIIFNNVAKFTILMKSSKSKNYLTFSHGEILPAPKP